jgi:hypothetical protein
MILMRRGPGDIILLWPLHIVVSHKEDTVSPLAVISMPGLFGIHDLSDHVPRLIDRVTGKPSYRHLGLARLCSGYDTTPTK